jgi:hypothetical protein
MDTRRSISSVIMIGSLVPVSLELQERAVSKCLKPPITRNAPMSSVNVYWEVCGESALPHMLILHEKLLHRVLHAYVAYFYGARPHLGIHQQVPEGEDPSVLLGQSGNGITAIPVLGGLHHEYRRVA